MGSLFGGGGEDALDAVRAGSQQAQDVLKNFKPVGVNAGGLRSTFSGGNINVSPTAARQQVVGGISNTFNSQAGALGGLREQVRPGFGRLTSARLQEVENARRRGIGNLQENLARRRVLGSSFGQDALTRAELSFAQEAEKAAAESFVQELEATRVLIGQEFEAARGAFQTQLTEFNVQADLASQLSTQATAVLAQLAGAQADVITSSAASEADLIKAQQEGQGKLLGSLISTGASLALAPVTGGGSLLGNALVMGK